MVEKRERFTYLELLRGITMLAVLAIHSTSYAIMELSKDSFLYPFYHIINTASHFAVPAFLFLSALLLFYHYDDGTKQNWLVFYRKRLKTIIVPYLLWSFFYLVIVMHIQQMSVEEGLWRYVKGLLIGDNYAHLYFIVIIAQFYLLFPLFHILLRNRFVKSHPLLCGSVVQIAFYILNHYIFHMNKVGTFIGSYLLYFFLGAYAASKFKAGGKLWRQRSLYFGFVISGIVYVGQMWLLRMNPHWIPQPYLSYLNFVSDYTYVAICCLVLLQVALLLESGHLHFLRKALFSIGTCSFGIYFIHPFFLLLWRQKVMTHGVISYHLLTIAGGLVALTLSWLITMVIQETSLGIYIVGKSDVRRRSPAIQTDTTKST